MCMERFIRLKCGHCESYQMDSHGCQNAQEQKGKDKGGDKAVEVAMLGRQCPNYVQVCIREDKHRSCPACKAVVLASLGVASPSLRRL